MNKKRDVGEIENDYDYFYDKNVVCLLVLLLDDVFDVVLYLDVEDYDLEDV